jgi:hypothetical protein
MMIFDKLYGSIKIENENEIPEGFCMRIISMVPVRKR